MNGRILTLIGIYILVILLFAYLRPEETDWTPSFSPDRTIPFASKVLYQELKTIRDEEIRNVDRPIYNISTDLNQDDRAVYFLLNPQFQPDALDITALLDFTAKGNTVFIASENLSYELLDTLGVQLEYEYLSVPNQMEWFYEDNIKLHLNQLPDETWPASVSSGYRWFILEDSTLTTQKILGTVDDQHPNFVSCNVGKGTIFLHAFPYAFSNYHMLYQDNHRYVSTALAEIPSSDIWLWDTYYLNAGGGQAQSPLAVLNRYQSFRWAYWLGIIGAVVFIVFTAKRRQRVIPLLDPKRNSTLDFIQTIGDLYFHRSDHADLITKKIAILQSQIQKRYRIEVVEFSTEDAREIAARGGLEIKTVETLFTQVRNLKTRQTVYAETLFGLQRNLDRFLKRM